MTRWRNRGARRCCSTELRARWHAAQPNDAPALAAEIGRWQQALWRFTSVGHIGKLNGPKAWMEPLSPLTAREEFKLKLPVNSGAGPASPAGAEVILYLTATDAGDGNDQDFAVWERPRLVAPGRPRRAVARSARRDRPNWPRGARS